MNRDELHAAAITLLNTLLNPTDSWQSGLARLLRIEPRTVRRWVQENSTPEWVELEIKKLMDGNSQPPERGAEQPVTTETLIMAGRALFGDRWQTDLGKALGYTDRTVRRWAAGECDPSPAVRASIIALINDRLRELNEVKKRLDRQY